MSDLRFEYFLLELWEIRGMCEQYHEKKGLEPKEDTKLITQCGRGVHWSPQSF